MGSNLAGKDRGGKKRARRRKYKRKRAERTNKWWTGNQKGRAKFSDSSEEEEWCKKGLKRVCVNEVQSGARSLITNHPVDRDGSFEQVNFTLESYSR